MVTTAIDSVEGDKFEAAFQRKGRTGLGFSSAAAAATGASSHAHSTEATRTLLSASSISLSASSSSSSSPSFSAQAYLARFGWTAGGGLGKKEDGAQTFLRVSKKDDTAGIGAGTAMQAVARSFESLYNNAARSINIVVHASDSDEEGEELQQEEEQQRRQREQEERQKVKEEKKERRKRKRAAAAALLSCEEPEDPSCGDDEGRAAAEADPSPSPSPPPAPSAPLHRAFRRGALLSDTVSAPPSPPLSAVAAQPSVFAADLLTAFDPQRSHMYHDRAQGKLARLRAQEEQRTEIVEQVRRKRWEGAEERKEQPQPQLETKAERKQRRRKERDALLQRSVHQPIAAADTTAEDADDACKRRKREKKHSEAAST